MLMGYRHVGTYNDALQVPRNNQADHGVPMSVFVVAFHEQRLCIQAGQIQSCYNRQDRGDVQQQRVVDVTWRYVEDLKTFQLEATNGPTDALVSLDPLMPNRQQSADCTLCCVASVTVRRH
jgi:hypothetical protein